MDKRSRITSTTIFGAAIFAFWMWLFPQALNYQEQNQLFLFTWDYFKERIVLPGGFADWLSEFLVQFFYYRLTGALILAVLAVLLQCAVWMAAGKVAGTLYAVSFLPSLLMLVHQGDVEVLVSFPVALTISIFLCPLFDKAGWHRLWLIPLVWWLLGPVVMVPVLVPVISGHRLADIIVFVFTLLVFYAGYRLMASQYPMRDALFGLNYYRLVESLPALQVIIPVVAVACIFLCGIRFNIPHPKVIDWMLFAVLVAGTAAGVAFSYSKDTYEVLAYDDMIRHERYEDVIKRAEKYQPRNPVSSCSVNFCLFMNGQLESRLTDFYQCGTQGLVLPAIRDNLSDITSAELLWMMGMPNITLQYTFDVQESIQNGRKSGRFMKRIAECNIVNGWYDRAVKYLDMLEHSLFYRKWAESRKAMIKDENLVTADPVYSYIRQVRFKDDFITFYDGLDLMMAVLYNQDKNNFMAAQYYGAWQRLKQLESAE